MTLKNGRARSAECNDQSVAAKIGMADFDSKLGEFETALAPFRAAGIDVTRCQASIEALRLQHETMKDHRNPLTHSNFSQALKILVDAIDALATEAAKKAAL